MQQISYIPEQSFEVSAVQAELFSEHLPRFCCCGIAQQCINRIARSNIHQRKHDYRDSQKHRDEHQQPLTDILEHINTSL